MKIINSVTNPLIKQIAKLEHRSERTARGMFIAEGLRTCKTLLKSNTFELVHLLIREGGLAAAQSLAQGREHQTIIVSDEVMNKLSIASTPSGFICVFKIPKKSIDSGVFGPGFILYQLQDPGNLGTLIRTAAALNKKTIFCIEGTDPYHPKVVQASAGTIGLVEIIPTSWHEVKKIATNNGLELCALTAVGGMQASKLSLEKSLLVVGNEAHGLPDTVVKSCSQQLTLSMPGNTESLNAAVAGSIAAYLAWNKEN